MTSRNSVEDTRLDFTLRIVKVSEEYINQLRTVDSRVCHNKSRRPYIGIIIKIDNYSYFAPLTSDRKRNYKHKSKGLITIVKIYKGSAKGGYVGAALLNNMIPVPESEISPIDIDFEKSKDRQYGVFLEQQYQYLRKKPQRDEIFSKARKLYQEVVARKGKFYEDLLSKVCCDFQALERACRDYSK